MSNPLRIASIKKEPTTDSKVFWETVLKPKWKARNKEKAERELKQVQNLKLEKSNIQRSDLHLLYSIIILFLISCSTPKICDKGHTHYRAYKYSLTH